MNKEGETCRCITGQDDRLVFKTELGMDSHCAEVSILVCQNCGQHWLRYFYENEAFPHSRRWFLGAITPGQAEHLTAAGALLTLEALSWYFYGGSYFDRQVGRVSDRVAFNP
jgi:hypothetical protein